MKRMIYIAVGVIVCAFLGIEVSKYWSQLDITQLEINYYHLIFVSLMLLSYYVINSFIWVKILNGCGEDVDWKKGLIIHNYSQAAKYLPGGMWNVLGRVYLCTSQGMNIARVTTSIFLEILLNMIAGFIIIVLTGYTVLSLNAYVVVAMIALILIWFYKPELVIKPALALYKKWKKEEVSLNVSRKQLIRWTLYFVAAWLFYSITFYLFITIILNIKVNYVFSIGVLIFSWIVGFISPIPGGLGVREGSMTALLSIQLPYADALLISLFSRFWLIAVEVVLYVTVFIFARRKNVSLHRNTDIKLRNRGSEHEL